MTKEEYDNTIAALNKTRDDGIRAARIEYAVTNNTVSVGDMVEDQEVKIRVERMRVSKNTMIQYPEMMYGGPILNADDTEHESGLHEEVRQCDASVLSVAVINQETK